MASTSKNLDCLDLIEKFVAALKKDRSIASLIDNLIDKFMPAPKINRSLFCELFTTLLDNIGDEIKLNFFKECLTDLKSQEDLNTSRVIAKVSDPISIEEPCIRVRTNREKHAVFNHITNNDNITNQIDEDKLITSTFEVENVKTKQPPLHSNNFEISSECSPSVCQSYEANAEHMVIHESSLDLDEFRLTIEQLHPSFAENFEVRKHYFLSRTYFTLNNGENVPCYLKKAKPAKDRKLLENETSNLIRFQNPGIVQIFGFIPKPDEYLLLIEHLEFGTLFRFVTNFEFSNIELLGIVADVSSTMQWMHRQGYIHRNLDIVSIFVGIDRHAKIGSLEACTRLNNDGYYKERDLKEVSRYSAPEVLDTGIYSKDSDVWSFGIVFWKVATIRNKVDFLPIFKEYIEKDRYPEVQFDIPELDELILECLCRNPNGRPPFSHISATVQKIFEIDK